MNYNEFDLLVKKLEELDLLDEIGNVTKWFRKIDKNKYENIMTLEKNSVTRFNEYKNILIDNAFLSSKYYLSDIEKIKCSNIKISQEIIELLNNKHFIESKYHEYDLDLILSSNNVNLNYLCEVAKSHTSIYSKYHNNDITLIHKCNNENTLKYLLKLSDSNNSLNGKYHESDIMIINECEKKENLSYLYSLADNYNSLNGKYHESDMKIISNANSFLDELLELAISTFSLNSSYHDSDMKMLLKGNNKNIKKLVDCAKNNMSENHNKFMNMILNCADENKLDLITKLSFNDSINLAMSIEKESNIDKLDLMKLLSNSYETSKIWIIDSIKDKEVIDKLIEYEEEKGFQSFVNALDYIKDQSDIDKKNYLTLQLKYIEKKGKQKELTNKEKIEIIKDNIYKYVDGDVKKEIPSRVFGLKEIKK